MESISISWILKLNALIGNLSIGCQAENLKSTTVRQNISIPRIESMKAAHLFDEIDAGTSEQMIGIAEHDLRLRIMQQMSGDSTNGPMSSHRHKHRGLERSVCQLNRPQARACAAVGLFDVKARRKSWLWSGFG